jgi:hypothetical protein
VVPLFLFASLALWVHTVRDVLQHARIWNRFTRFMHFSDHHRSELPTAVLTAALGTLLLLRGL